MAINKVELAAALRYLADKVERATGGDGTAPIDFSPSDGNTAPAPDSGDPWTRAGMTFATLEARIVAASRFDEYVTHPTDWRLNKSVPLESPEWIGVITAKYGDPESYIKAAMASQNVSREQLGRWMRAVFEHRGFPVAGWWAQWFGTSPA